MKRLILLVPFFLTTLMSVAQQTFLFPDTLRNKNTPLLTDSSDKLPNTQWIKQQHYRQDSTGNYILNQQSSPQTAHYNITNSSTNSGDGSKLGIISNNFNWNTNVTDTSGALYSAGFHNVTHNFNYNGKQTLDNTVTFATSFNRLTLYSTSSANIDLTGNGAAPGVIPRAISALETQVYLPAVASGNKDTVSDVASITIKSAYQDPGTAQSFNAINYYQLLIEPSNNNIFSNALANTYGIYQLGTQDTNVFKGPINYTNKYSSGALPSIAAATGAGSSASVTITGTTDGGVVTIITGSSPSSSATIATITFYEFSFPTGCSVILFPASRNAAALTGAQAVYTSGGTGAWTLSSGTTSLAASTTYIWNYQVSGY